VPRGGKRLGAGRRPGTGKYGCRTRLVRAPIDLIPEIEELLARRAREEAQRRAEQKKSSYPAIEIPPPKSVVLLPKMDALDALQAVAAAKIQCAAVVLDPWYRAKGPQGRGVYVAEVLPLINAAAEVGRHVFLWGWAEALGRVMDLWSPQIQFETWLTWCFKNSANRGKGWRPAQQSCIHLRRRGAKMYPHSFMAERLQAHALAEKLEFKMSHRSFFFEEGLLSGFIGRSQQQNYRAQKPTGVFDRLLQMCAQPGDLILDVTAGSGTAGVSAINAGCSAILSDRSPKAHQVMRERLGGYIVGSNLPLPSKLR